MKKNCSRCKKKLDISNCYKNDFYCKNCRIKTTKIYARKYAKTKHARELKKMRRNSKKGKQFISKFNKKYANKLRTDVLNHYSDGDIKCSICKCDNIDVLSINHINGDGIKHRNKIKIKGGSIFYRWLKKNSFPSGFRVLCRNCNWLEHLKRMEKKRINKFK